MGLDEVCFVCLSVLLFVLLMMGVFTTEGGGGFEQGFLLKCLLLLLRAHIVFCFSFFGVEQNNYKRDNPLLYKSISSYAINKLIVYEIKVKIK